MNGDFHDGHAAGCPNVGVLVLSASDDRGDEPASSFPMPMTTQILARGEMRKAGSKETDRLPLAQSRRYDRRMPDCKNPSDSDQP